MQKNKTVSINNFIGVYDNYITKEECGKAIKLYEDQNKFNNTVNRIGFEKASILQKQDQQFFANSNNLNIWWEELKSIVIWPAAFPYVHRGNPPLSGEKYILTSWMMLR